VRRILEEGVDIDAFRSRLSCMIAEGRAEEAIRFTSDTIEGLNWAVVQLSLSVQQLTRKYLGKTTEKIDPAQLQLLLRGQTVTEAELDEALKDDDEEDEEPRKRKRPKRPKGEGGRKPLPEHLKRTRVEVPIDPEECVCKKCRGAKSKIGEETSETLGMEPAKFYVVQYVRSKFACTKCDECDHRISIAPVADKVIERGRPEADLLAHVLVSKYNDHCPLHRIHRIYLRYGVDVAVSTLMDWVTAGHVMLAPLVRAIIRACIAAYVLQVDDTGIKVLDNKASGGSKRGRLWCHVGDGTWAAFRYTPDWSGEHPQKFLADRVGPTQADAYKGYDAIFDRENATAIEIACMAHARRYWVDVLEAGDQRAAVPLKLIQKMYRVERRAKKYRLTPEQRLALRKEKSRPIFDLLSRWIAQHHGLEPPKSLFAKACGYWIRQQVALSRFLEIDGRIPIDNTAVERALRPICCGRRNYLFCGSDRGAEWAATMYTILGTCALNGVEPLAYLTDVLKKLASGWPASKIDELLPPNWIASHPEHRIGIPAPAAQ
jgi:transposase